MFAHQAKNVFSKMHIKHNLPRAEAVDSAVQSVAVRSPGAGCPQPRTQHSAQAQGSPVPGNAPSTLPLLAAGVGVAAEFGRCAGSARGDAHIAWWEVCSSCSIASRLGMVQSPASSEYVDPHRHEKAARSSSNEPFCGKEANVITELLAD